MGNKRLGPPALKVRWIKICRSYCECPEMTALVLTFGAKAFNDTELCNACLAGGNTFVISRGETNKNVTVKILKKHMAYVNFTSLFSSQCSTVAPKIYNFLKNKHTTHICSGREDKGCKNLAHTSKTRQVKHRKWLQLLGSRFDCLSLFQTAKNRTQRNRRAKGCDI